MRKINLIAIHCSASPNGARVTAQEIDRWHAARGFTRDPGAIGFSAPDLKHIGYHNVIYSNGVVVQCRGIEEAGIHVAGYNSRSIGICMIGTDRFKLAQWNSLELLVRGTIGKIARRINLPGAPQFMPESAAIALYLASKMNLRICGHRDLSPDKDGDGTVEPHEWLKTCPGFDVASWIASGMTPPAAHILPDHISKPEVA